MHGDIIISKSDVYSSNRNFKIGYDSNFNFIFGDYGNSNSAKWTQQLIINSNANAYSINISSNNYIGIYNSNPSYTLDVNGVVNAVKFIGTGSNITNIDYNNITPSTIPTLSNLNNWINSNSQTILYTLASNVNINTFSNLNNYCLNVNGSINGINYLIMV